MAYTKRELDAESPSVEWINHSDGTLTAVLHFYREKRGGDLEETVVKFRDLEVEEAACIGRSARIAIYRASSKVKERMDAAYNRVITPGN